MKLAKKDKIMLIVLGVIMFVAVFFVYMIMPANEEGKALDAQITTKKAEAQKVMTDLAAIDTNSVQEQIDNLYDYYYAEKAKDTGESGLHPVLGPIDIEKKMYAIFHDPEHTLEGYETRPWKSMIVTQNVTGGTDGSIMTSVDMVVATIEIRFQIVNREQLQNLIQYFYDDPYFRIIDLTVTENQPGQDGAAPEYQFDSTMHIEFYMGDKYTTDRLPKPLNDVNVAIKEGTVIKFTGVANAKYYELYEVVIAEDGTKTFNKIQGTRIELAEGNGEYTVQVPDVVFGDGASHNIAVRAIGDQEEGYFKSIMSKDTKYVTLSKAA